ncbi:hypothetical protein GCM10027057_27480 [Marisediminicola antarctica]|uniref:Lipocalin-like domain-containing protein n=1 Tax=Marisediminicola antarctica TaxID=674079 RepID=A0A7L5AFV2_9MICO|nr:hypothetical protein BHD05_03615 [Marisediminicola antarctica]
MRINPTRLAGRDEEVPVTKDEFVGTWINSHEEDRDGVQVFRSEEYEFPPSRGRMSFTLRADGSAITGQPGPDDRGVTGDGSWRIDGTVLTIRSPGGSATYGVLAADSSHLELRPH